MQFIRFSAVPFLGSEGYWAFSSSSNAVSHDFHIYIHFEKFYLAFLLSLLMTFSYKKFLAPLLKMRDVCSPLLIFEFVTQSQLKILISN